MMNRRQILATGASAAILPFAGLTAAAAEPAAEISMLSWGGMYQDIFRPVAEAFEKDTGTKVRFVVQSGAADGLNKLIAQRNRPQVDVWASIASTVQAAEEDDLLVKFDAARIPHLNDLPAEYVKNTSASIWFTPRGIFYRKDLAPFEPRTWEDLWDPRLKDSLAVTLALDRGSFLIVAALLNGGSEHDIDKGFENMAKLKPNIHAVYTSEAEAIRLLETGEVAVVAWGPLSNFYHHLGPDSQYGFALPSPRFLADIPVSIVAGRPPAQQAAAEMFVDYLLRPEYQTIMTSLMGSIPSNPKAELPEKLKDLVPGLPLTDVYQVDWAHVNGNFSSWQDRWAQEVLTRR